ncbi:GNAT family N-acetyltransferase [Vibrio amylolyticus]|uniref:GNAT family N-acetyltransferase n=1 Tax=Vibrio amylolyticus TaxID=2847292 RepID=UPI00354F02BA
MNTLVFRVCDESSPYWADLERLFQSEWAEFSFVDTYRAKPKLPPVILAVRNNEVIGGLAYSRFQDPHGSSEVVWVNAVYVLPEWRGKGIASELINRGVSQVSATTQSNLYAYTNVPSLYESLGWLAVGIESEPNHSVMSIPLRTQPRV